MKKIVLFIIVVAMSACGSTDQNGGVTTDEVSNSATANGEVSGNLPEIKFEEEVFDFGKITQGERVSHSFAFKNTGKKNLIISGASGSCGCTVPEWPKEPIKPGTEGKINVVFNSEGKSGLQEKTVTVVTNCEPATRIVKIKAEIIVAETVKDTY